MRALRGLGLGRLPPRQDPFRTRLRPGWTAAGFVRPPLFGLQPVVSQVLLEPPPEGLRQSAAIRGGHPCAHLVQILHFGPQANLCLLRTQGARPHAVPNLDQEVLGFFLTQEPPSPYLRPRANAIGCLDSTPPLVNYLQQGPLVPEGSHQSVPDHAILPIHDPGNEFGSGHLPGHGHTTGEDQAGYERRSVSPCTQCPLNRHAGGLTASTSQMTGRAVCPNLGRMPFKRLANEFKPWKLNVLIARTPILSELKTQRTPSGGGFHGLSKLVV